LAVSGTPLAALVSAEFAVSLHPDLVLDPDELAASGSPCVELIEKASCKQIGAVVNQFGRN